MADTTTPAALSPERLEEIHTVDLIALIGDCGWRAAAVISPMLRDLLDEVHRLRAAKDLVRERAAAALVLPTDTVDAGEWSIVTCRRAVEDGLREWLADVCPELLEGLDWPGGANELIDRIKEQAK